MSTIPTDLLAHVLRYSTEPGSLLHALITTKQHRAIWSMKFPGSFQHAVYHCFTHDDVKLLQLLAARAPEWVLKRVNWVRLCTHMPMSLHVTTCAVLNSRKITPLISYDNINRIAYVNMHPAPIGILRHIDNVKRVHEIKAQRKHGNTTVRNMRMRMCIHRRAGKRN